MAKRKRWFESLSHDPHELRKDAGRGALLLLVLAPLLVLLFLLSVALLYP